MAATASSSWPWAASCNPTGVGPVEVRRAKVRDRGEGAEQKIRFTSSILPKWARNDIDLEPGEFCRDLSAKRWSTVPAEAVVVPRNPIVGSFGRCALAASGQALRCRRAS